MSFSRIRKDRLIEENLNRTRIDFFKNLMAIKKLNATTLAKRAGISRQTLYNILKGDTVPDTATLVKLAGTLEIDVSALVALNRRQETIHRDPKPVQRTRQRELAEKALEVAQEMGLTAADIVEFLVYLRKSWLLRYRKHEGFDWSSLIGDLTYPDDTVVCVNQEFEKRWAIQNAGAVPWIGRKLVCADPRPGAYSGTQNVPAATERNRLVALEREVAVPKTMPGDGAVIAARLKAPPRPCTAASSWKMTDEYGKIPLSEGIGLSCRVIVVGL